MPMRLTTQYRNAPPLDEVGALLRLANSVHLTAPNPIVRHRRMLDGLREVTRATLAVSLLIARGTSSHVLTMICSPGSSARNDSQIASADEAINDLFRDGEAIRALLNGR